jgi:undecaprenyl-diphosphatase
MIDKILQLDRELFVFLNGLGSERFDGLWSFITSQINWIPVFLIFAYLVFKHLGWKHSILILVMIALLITLTDQTTNLFKNGFQRLRPGSDPDLAHLIRAIQTRKSFSFISGHASNSMASAMFLYLVLKPHVKYMGFIFLWPLIFAYSRIYLGLHYPLDILCGYVWGIMMAFIMWEIYQHSKRRFFPDEPEFLDDAANGQSVANRQ